jgi:carboxylesterase
MINDKDELKSLKHLAKPFYFEGTSKIGVLLVHGFTASPTEMLPLGKYLHKKGYTVHGIRLAGHGTNYRDMINFTWHDWHDSVMQGFLRLNEKFDLIIPIGISMGALLCLNLIKELPKTDFQKLVMLAPPFALKSRLVAFTPLLKFFVKYLYKGEESLNYFKKHNLYSYMYRPTESVIQLLRFIKYLELQQNRITVPTLILYGSKDEMISKTAIEKARKKHFSDETDVKIQMLPNSGHILTVEPDWQRMFGIIEEFLR